MNKTAFFGLGVMGAPMAGHLVTATVDVCAATRTPGKAEAWARRTGGRSADLPADAAADADLIVTMLRNDADLDHLFWGTGGIGAAIKPGAIVIDHTTASPAMARERGRRLGERGVAFADAPVSGAEAGTLSVMVGCDEGDLARVQGAVAPYAAQCRRIGPVGAGQMAKLINQVCIAGVIQGVAEGLALGVEAGLDMAATLRAIGRSAAQSWQMDNRAETMLRGEFDFGFSTDLMRKDLGLALKEAERMGLDLSVARAVEGFLAGLQASGMGGLDNSALITRLIQVPACSGGPDPARASRTTEAAS